MKLLFFLAPSSLYKPPGKPDIPGSAPHGTMAIEQRSASLCSLLSRQYPEYCSLRVRVDHCSRVTSPLFPAHRSLDLKPAGYYHNLLFVYIHFLFVFISFYLPLYLSFTAFARCTGTSFPSSVTIHRAFASSTCLTLIHRSSGLLPKRPIDTLCHTIRARGKSSHERCRCVPFSEALHFKKLGCRTLMSALSDGPLNT